LQGGVAHSVDVYECNACAISSQSQKLFNFAALFVLGAKFNMGDGAKWRNNGSIAHISCAFVT
jgi:hypothetical protein